MASKLVKTLLPIAGAFLGGPLLGGGLMNTFTGLQLGQTLAGMMGEKDDRGLGGLLQAKMEKWNKGPDQMEGWDRNLYASMITGAKFSTEQERDAYDRNIRARHAENSENKQIATPLSGIQTAAGGGLIQGPGNITSDSIPGTIRQGGVPVDDIAVSNGEVILSGRDLAALDPSGNQDRAGMRLGGAANGSRGAEAAKMFSEMQRMRGMN
jgi:hypothetical protein|tara:strand:- start:1888 stop:2517 length:630 start_codon:yes stop_codon:yes gene_type:complete